MRKVLMIFLVLAFVGIFIGITLYNAEAGNCTTVKDRTLSYSPGHYLYLLQPIKPGFDPFGYNYQAHLFNGYYANTYLGKDGFPPYEGDDVAYLNANPGAASKWYWPYRNVALMMKWNDAWLSNKDCGTQVGQAQYTDLDTPDGNLDRHYPIDSYIGSGAWITNHMQEDYEVDGKKCSYVYFTKIVAVPADAEKGDLIYHPTTGALIDWTWYTADGTKIGPQIWGSFATIQSVYNEPCGDIHGIEYLSPAAPGFGKWK